MVFMIILLVVTIVAAVLLGIYAKKGTSDGAEVGAWVGAWVSGIAAFILVVLLICCGIEAKENKALIQAHLDNPTSYTYSQLAEHNELVTKRKVWQGTIFSFYNDTDLQTIDIDSISQKVIIDSQNN